MEFFDITLILLGVAGLAGFAWKMFIAPKIPETTLSTLQKVANIAVYAAEAIWGRGFGEEKFTEALKIVQDFLAKYKIKFDSETIIAAIKGEWLKMDQEQIRDGIKNPTSVIEPKE